MKQKRISFGQGKGSLTHNNRTFIANNVDTSRIPDNVTFKCQPIGEAYEQLFGESTERYNAKQKRNDRKIHGTYYESLFHQKPSNSVVIATDKRKSFYEDVVQVGKMEDSGYGTEDFQPVADCLKEYMAGFQERNPNFYVFNAVLHMDEATPHLHIDYISVGHYKRGQDTQNGIAQALKEMGYGEGKNVIARWRAAEVDVLNQICIAHGIEPLAPEKSRGTLEIPEYKEQKRKAEQLSKENEQIETQLSETKSQLEKAEKRKAKLVKIDSIETKKSMFGKKVTLSESDFENLTALAEKSVVYVTDTKKLLAEKSALLQKVADLEQRLKSATDELSKYKKPATISRDVLKKQAKDISEKEQLKIKLRKAMAVIDAYGLREEYERIKVNSTKNRNELE
jgi:hypothetical protein